MRAVIGFVVIVVGGVLIGLIGLIPEDGGSRGIRLLLTVGGIGAICAGMAIGASSQPSSDS